MKINDDETILKEILGQKKTNHEVGFSADYKL